MYNGTVGGAVAGKRYVAALEATMVTASVAALVTAVVAALVTAVVSALVTAVVAALEVVSRGVVAAGSCAHTGAAEKKSSLISADRFLGFFWLPEKRLSKSSGPAAMQTGIHTVSSVIGGGGGGGGRRSVKTVVWNH